jgi:hypothetical protein
MCIQACSPSERRKPTGLKSPVESGKTSAAEAARLLTASDERFSVSISVSRPRRRSLTSRLEISRIVRILVLGLHQGSKALEIQCQNCLLVQIPPVYGRQIPTFVN